MPIDLRSDTVTSPTPEMRRAMMAAEVGDDQYGEDPATNELQARASALLGKEAALWLPSGTQANQVALMTLTRPGDEVIVARESHALWHEAGGASRNAGVQLTEIGEGGVFTAHDVMAALKPADHPLYPRTSLIEIENTHNRAGGVIFPQAEAERICALAHARGVAAYLDGARLWNVAAATGTAPADLAAPFDMVMVAFSKGLGAPGGSLLAGTKPMIAEATRHRRLLGGAMRQVGFFAAAALYGLDHHMARLQEDHANARDLAQRLAQVPGIALDLTTVQTNIVIFRLTDEAPATATVLVAAKGEGVLVSAFGPRTLRAVTHLDVTAAQCRQAGDVLARIIGGR